MRSGPICSLLLLMVVLAAGCHRAADPNAVTVGMSADQVRAALGEPRILGGFSSNINGVVKIRENWTYPMGDDGLVIVMENGKVVSRSIRQNQTRAWLRQVHPGMTKEAVIAAIGDTKQRLPAPPPNPAEQNPTEKWMYTDAAAPVEILMVHFRDNRVVKAECVPNGIYIGNMPAPGPGMR